MPSRSGILTESEMKEVIKNLDAKKMRACSACAEPSELLIDRQLAWIPTPDMKKGVPVVMVSCRNCRVIRFIIAQSLGVSLPSDEWRPVDDSLQST